MIHRMLIFFVHISIERVAWKCNALHYLGHTMFTFGRWMHSSFRFGRCMHNACACTYRITKHLTNKLQRLYTTAAWLITKTKKTDVLIRLHWLPVEYRSQYKLIFCVFKALSGLAPFYLTELLKPFFPSRSLRSLSTSLLQVPTTRTKTYDNHRFDRTAWTLWNNIPLQLKSVDWLSAFKWCLKTYLFKHAFRLWIFNLT